MAELTQNTGNPGNEAKALALGYCLAAAVHGDSASELPACLPPAVAVAVGAHRSQQRSERRSEIATATQTLGTPTATTELMRFLPPAARILCASHLQDSEARTLLAGAPPLRRGYRIDGALVAWLLHLAATAVEPSEDNRNATK